jgi:hypothetical protein
MRWLGILLWTLGGFVVGVLANSAIEAAGIALSGDFDWGFTSRPTWFRVLVPYASAVLGALIGIALSKRDSTNIYKRLAFGLSAVMAVAIGVVLNDARALGAQTAALPVESTTTSTTTPSSTSTSWTLPPIEVGLGFYNETVGFWNDTWIPTIEQVAASGNAGDEPSARIECELVRGNSEEIIDDAMFYVDSELRRLIIGMLREMETFFEQCSSGEWATADSSRELVGSYMERIEACFEDPECT